MSVLSKEREKLAKMFESFLLAKVDVSVDPAFQDFKKSPDCTVKYACEILESYFEVECNNQLLLGKSDRDYIERVRLLLLSGYSLSRTHRYVFGLSNSISLAALVVVCVCCKFIGLSFALVPIFIAAGIVSILIGRISKSPVSSQWSVNTPAIYPFSSYSQLLQARRSNELFKKVRVQAPCQALTSLNWGETLLQMFLTAALSPLSLLLFALPTEFIYYEVEEKGGQKE